MSDTNGAATASPDGWGEGWAAPAKAAPAKAAPSKAPPPPPPAAAAPSDGWGAGWASPPPPPTEDYGKAIGSGVTQGVVGPLEAQVPTPKAFGYDPITSAAQWTRENVMPSWLTSGAAKLRESLPSPADVAQKVTAGTPFDPSYKPQTFGGKVAQTAGALLPAAAIGPLAPEALATRAVTQAAIPAVTTEVGRSLGERVGHPELGAMVGGAIAPFAIGPAGRTLIPSQAVEEASSTLGTRLPPPFAGSESPAAELTAKGVSKLPLVRAPLRSSARAAQEELGGAAAGVAERAGATTPETTGAAVEQRFNADNAGVSAAANQRYNAVTDALPPGQAATATGPLDNLQQAAVDIANRRAASGGPPGAAINAVTQPLTMGDMTYQGMRDLRTRLRQEGDAGGLTPQERGEYNSLESAVTNDINKHLDTLDPSGNATKLMADADQTYASDRGRLQAVGRRLGIDNPSVGNEQYVNKIESMALGGKQDSELLAQTRQTLGNSVADQTAAQIAKKWWTGPDGNFAPQQFFKKYDALTPEAKDALFGQQGSGGFRDSYDALSTLAKRDKTLQSVLPSEGGGGHPGLSSAIGGAIGVGGEGAAAHFLGPAAVPLAIKGVVGAAAPLVLSTLLARPEIAAAAARVGRATRGLEAANRMGIPDARQNAAKILAAETARFQEQAKNAGYDAGQQ